MVINYRLLCIGLMLTPIFAAASDDRFDKNTKVTPQLAALSDSDLQVLLEKAKPLSKGIGGTCMLLHIDDVPVFVKKIPLTDLERKHYRSTKNIFNLPLCYQYGIGSAGFGVWRELEAHLMTTQWVLNKECEHFPILYHWRELTKTKSQDACDVAKDVAYWGGSLAIKERLEALHYASSDVILFLEYIPHPLHKFLDGEINDSTVEMLDRDLTTIADFMASKNLLHFDAHFRNILTDDQRLYLTDFGLTTSPDFDLSEEEQSFIKRHRDFDKRYMMAHLVDVLEKNMGILAQSIKSRGASDYQVMDEFFKAVMKDKTVEYEKLP